MTGNSTIDNLYFYLTYSCNLRCKHCWADCILDHDSAIFLPIDIFLHILQQGNKCGVSSIKLTGGEPLLHPNINYIIVMVKEHGFRLTIESNGTLLTPELADLIAQGIKPFASISIDSHDERVNDLIRGMRGAYTAAVRAIEYLVSRNVKTQLVATLFKDTINHISDLTQMAQKIGCSSIKFNIVQPSGRGNKLYEKNQLPLISELLSVQEIISELNNHFTIPILYDLPIAFKSLNSIYNNGKLETNFCNISRIVGILPDGNYSLCGIGYFIEELAFGHAGTTDLVDVICNSKVMKEIREGMPKRLKGICSLCLMKAACNGACIAQNYSSSKSLWAPFWFCQKAFDEGLFPDERLLDELTE